VKTHITAFDLFVTDPSADGLISPELVQLIPNSNEQFVFLNTAKIPHPADQQFHFRLMQSWEWHYGRKVESWPTLLDLPFNAPSISPEFLTQLLVKHLSIKAEAFSTSKPTSSSAATAAEAVKPYSRDDVHVLCFQPPKRPNGTAKLLLVLY